MYLKKTTFLKTIVYILGLLVLILTIFVLPLVADSLATQYPEYAYLKWPMLIGIYVTAIPFFIALYEALKLLRFIDQNDAFTEAAVKSLKTITQCAVAIVVCYASGIFILTLLNAVQPGLVLIGLIIVFASLIIALFAALLRELLRKVVAIKSENELTI